MDALRKSFKASESLKREEERQILLTKKPESSMAASAASPSIKINVHDSPAVINSSSVDGSANTMWRDSTYDYSNDVVSKAPSPGSRDFDIETESSFSRRQSPLSQVPPGNSSRSNAEPDEIIVCSSNASFRRKSSLMRVKTKSRLLDPPEDFTYKSQTQRIARSQIIAGKDTSEAEDDDPFLEDDLPEEYKKMKFSVLSVIQLLSLILIISALICSLTITVLKHHLILGLSLWKWELMVLVLISGRLVSGWGIRIVVFLIERNFLLRKRVLYFVYGLRNAVQNCVWLALVLVAWQLIFDKKVETATKGKYLPYVTKVWVCLLIGTLIWLVKTLLVKVLASSFHVSTFFDRIQESLFNQYVIEMLCGPPVVEIRQEMEEEERVMIEVQKLQNAGITIPPDLKASVLQKSGRVIRTPMKNSVSPMARSPMLSRVMSKKEQEHVITIDHLHRLNQKNISAWNMKRLMNIVKNGVLLTLDEKIHGSTNVDEAMVQITSENEARVAARKIFNNVAKPGSKYMYKEDLMRFMREDEVMKTMQLFEDGRERKGMSKRALKDWVVNVFRERRALALSLDDTKTAVKKLHHMLNVMVGIAVVCIWLLILKVATTHFFIFLSSQVLLVVFMFGNTCKTTFEAIIFLFVIHPFDVGDRVEIEGVQMIVEEMNILTTIFLKFDNHKIYYPNSVLLTKPINNYYRSPDMGDAIDFCIHISTPAEKIASMKERIASYVDNRSDHWHPAPRTVVRDMEDLNRLKFSVWLTHRMNHQDMGQRWVRRSLLVEEMVKIFRDLDIEYRLLPLDVNLRNVPALSSSRLPSNWTTCAH